jgi:hypothetical protein
MLWAITTYGVMLLTIVSVLTMSALIALEFKPVRRIVNRSRLSDISVWGIYCVFVGVVSILIVHFVRAQ